jgi:hypothetical protein
MKFRLFNANFLIFLTLTVISFWPLHSEATATFDYFRIQHSEVGAMNNSEEGAEDNAEKELPGGPPARRLEEFLKSRLPQGVLPQELNPEIAKKKKDESSNPEKIDKDRE